MPLVTPAYRGLVDEVSVRNIVRILNRQVDGYVPCLSTGEGKKLGFELWCDMVATTVKASSKPVFAGILKNGCDEVVHYAAAARELGCSGVVMPPLVASESEVVAYFETLTPLIELPIIVYSVAENPIKTAECVIALNSIDKIIGIKDSTGNASFFRSMLRLKADRQIDIALFQGLEMDVPQSGGADGLIIALAHLEPILCRRMLSESSKELHETLAECVWKYNLRGEWYVTLKAVLMERGMICSAEQVMV